MICSSFAHYVSKELLQKNLQELPVIINAVFSNVNPIPAAAQPEYEFNIEITTGISAPPIGIIKRNPIKKENKINIQNN
jgi:hypothetical protein